MDLYVGTSGFAYKAWKGSFYPEAIAEKAMLGWYAEQLNAVEINSTFYRFPTSAGLKAWGAQVPDGFRFAIKVPQRITHTKRLHDVDDDVGYLVDTVTTLGPRLGPLLFQTPPNLKRDVASLENLAWLMPPGLRVAFEFRHQSWFCEEVYRLLRKEGHALCFNDALMGMPHPGADWGYFRLRREQYTEADLTTSIETLRAQPWREAYVFIKHEAPDSPLLARRFGQLAREANSR